MKWDNCVHGVCIQAAFGLCAHVCTSHFSVGAWPDHMYSILTLLHPVPWRHSNQNTEKSKIRSNWRPLYTPKGSWGVTINHLGQLEADLEASKPVSVVLSHFPPSREWESL